MAEILPGLLDQSLLENEFYFRSLSLFMLGSYGIKDRVKANLSILQNVASCGDELFKRLDFWYYKDSNTGDGEDYFTLNYGDNAASIRSANSEYWLDLIGNIFGIKREVYCATAISGYSSGVIKLNNLAFLSYIQATAVKNIFDGKNITLYKYYNLQPSILQSAQIKYHTMANSTCTVYLSNSLVDPQIILLFVNGYLTVESLGITYIYASSTTFRNAVFNTATYFNPASTTTIDVFQKREN